MEYQTHQSDGTVILALRGELDEVTAPDLRPEIDRIVAEMPRHVRLDLTRLTLINSVGVGLVVSFFKANRANGGTFEVTGLQGQPEMIFQVLYLDQVFGKRKI